LSDLLSWVDVYGVELIEHPDDTLNNQFQRSLTVK